MYQAGGGPDRHRRRTSPGLPHRAGSRGCGPCSRRTRRWTTSSGASKRSGRFDWANIAFSTLFSIALAAAFDPERAPVLFEILVTPVCQLIAGPSSSSVSPTGRGAAIVGYILDEQFTDPAISELVVTSDGFVLAQSEGEAGANDLVGEEADLNRNLLSLIEAAGLSEAEVQEFARLQRQRIHRYSRR